MSEPNELAFLHDIPIDLVVELGRTTLSLEILAGGQTFAKGEVVVVDDRVALRITDLIERGRKAESA